jgi:hypothetical protein
MASGPADYPVFRQEVAYWDARLGGRWRLGEYFGLATLVNLCLLPATLLFFPGLLAAYAVFDEILLLAVILPASVLVVRERQAGTWSLLRATPMTSLQLATAKLAGLLYLGWEGASYLVGARWLGTLFTIPLLVLIALMPGSELPGPLAAGLVLAYALFIVRPRLNLLFGGSLGLMASTFGRSASGAMILSGLLAWPLLLAYLWLQHWYVGAVNPGEWLGGGVLAGVLAQVFAWLLPMGAITLARALLAPLFFVVAALRISQLHE